MRSTKSTSQKWPMPTNSNPYDRNRSDRQQPGAITAPDCFGLDRLVRVLGLTRPRYLSLPKNPIQLTSRSAANQNMIAA
jgi:hypothetical protein